MTDPIDDLLIGCMQQPAAQWQAAIARLCLENATLADEIRRRFDVLRQMGLVDATPAAADFPDRLGEYELHARLGGGGMGVVYRARQTSMDRVVALKLVRPEQLFFPGAKARFEREIAAVARLSHPNIVAIHALGEEHGVPFFAMELVDGITLDEVLRELGDRPPSSLRAHDLGVLVGRRAAHPGSAADNEFYRGTWEEVCLRVARAIALALAHAHAHGVVHRDVKPSNVMLTAAGRVVLLDFGLALAPGADRLTRTGSQLGSLPYMAPEQLRGDRARIDATTDVYALGVTLFEMLALRSPFLAASTETTRQNILLGNAPSLRACNRALRRASVTVCIKAFQADPRRRYQSAAALADDLDNALAGRGIAAQPDGVLRRGTRQAQRHPAWTVGLGLGLLILLGGPITILFAVTGERDRAIGAERQAVASAYAANLAAASAAIAADDPFEARRRLDLCDRELRGFEWRHLDRALDGSLVVLAGHAAPVTAVALAPDGKTVASGAADGELRLWDWRHGHEGERCATGGQEIVTLRFSADGERLVVLTADGRLRVRDLDQQRWSADRASPAGYEVVRLTRWAESLLANHGGWRFEALDPRSLASARAIALEPTDRAPDDRFTADGVRIVADCRDHLAVWDQESGRLLQRVTVQAGARRAMALAPDGLVACGYVSAGVTVYDSMTGQLVQRIDSRAQVERVFFDDDGSLLAVSALDQVIRVYESRSGRLLTVLRGHTAPVRALAFAGEEELVVSGADDGSVRVWSALFTRDQVVLGQHTGAVSAVAVRADGQRVFTGSHDGSVGVWAPTSCLLERLVDHPHHVNALTTTAQGRTMLSAFHNRVVLSDPDDTNSPGSLVTQHAFIVAIVPDPAETAIATCGSEGTVEIWDLRERTRRTVISVRDAGTAASEPAVRQARTAASGRNVPAAAVWNACFSFDGSEIYTGSEDGRVGVWAAGDGEHRRTLVAGGAPVQALQLVDGGRKLVCAEGSMLRARDPACGTILWERPTRMPIRCLAVLADGARLCTGAEDGSITFWDGASGDPILTRRVHDGVVASLAFDRRGRFLATASHDGTCQLLFADGVASEPEARVPATLAHAARRIIWNVGRTSTNERIVAAVARRTDLSPQLRALIAQIVSSRTEPWYHRFLDLLELVEDPNAARERYLRALADAQEYAQVTAATPLLGATVLALAHLRLGQNGPALEDAERGLAANGEADTECKPMLLAVRAIALQRLDRIAAAQESLRTLIELCARPPYALDPRALAFWREAEAALAK